MRYYSLIVGLAACTISCNYDETPIQNNNVIRGVTFEKPSLEADGFSKTKVMVELPLDADSDKRTIEIRTSNGTFAEADGKNVVNALAIQDETTTPFRLVAQATLISSQTEGTATITAQIAGNAQSKQYVFTTAYPDALVITPSQLTLKQGAENELKITVTLTRQSGIPSLNQIVKLNVTDLAGNKKGRFREELPNSDATGKSYFTYSLGTDMYIGKLVVRASADVNKIKTDTIYAQ